MKEYRLFSRCLLAAMFLVPFSLDVKAQTGRPGSAPAAKPAPVQTPARNPVPVSQETKVEIPEIVAEVSGDKIMKTDLAEECLRIHGSAELADLVKKNLIAIECERSGIVIKEQEINDEIVRMAKTFKFSTEEWLNLLEQERGISAEQYKQDIILPMLSIRKLAGTQLTITAEEIQKEYDARFGRAVQVRQIILKSKSDAEQIHAEVKANPEAFASIAKNYSMDPASQPYGGLVHPIRPGSLKNPAMEQIVFNLKPGEISSIVEYPKDVFIIFKCEQHLEPENVDIEKVKEQLVMKITDAKTRVVSEEIFDQLQKNAEIRILLGDPRLMVQAPGVAAFVNGKTIGMQALSEHCLDRHGKTVLNDMISKLIVEQACRKHNVVITDADIDEEIREMAIKYVPLRKDGQPDTDRWMQLATSENRVSPEIYRTNTIWPVLALKRLVRVVDPRAIEVTKDDITRGYEANFGEKVRCLAIAFHLTDQRRALEVWQMANRTKTAEHFGELAEKYSVDAESRMNKGVIPSIAKHCGQKALEDEAFKLLPNEISQIIQVEDNLIILYCLGRDPATVADIEEVRADLIADIFEKKMKLAVSLLYDLLYKRTAFDNYLTKETQNPAVEQQIREADGAMDRATGNMVAPRR